MKEIQKLVRIHNHQINEIKVFNLKLISNQLTISPKKQLLQKKLFIWVKKHCMKDKLMKEVENRVLALYSIQMVKLYTLVNGEMMYFGERGN